MPEPFRNKAVQWVGPGFLRSHPEWGMITWATKTDSASSRMIRFSSYGKHKHFASRNKKKIKINKTTGRTSHEERFHKTPVTSSWTSASGRRVNSRTSDGIPPALCNALLFSSFCRPYDKFLQSSNNWEIFTKFNVNHKNENVPERPASVAVDVGLLWRDEADEERDAAQEPRLLLNRVAVVAEVLQVSGRVRLDHGVGVVEESDHLVQVGIAPSHTWRTERDKPSVSNT